ncbi:hypothetical protein DFJ63DRAFT_20500 [Scheffersomyces coipomensis]|uniref:uncharacterized protein n=1 Tax=Scheffersomyces coipomensis TaxID=1788519 RepID=UPI00315CE74A
MAINIDHPQVAYSGTSPISISTILTPITTNTHKKKRKQSISSPLLIKSSKSLKQSISIGSIKSDLYNQRLNTYKNHPLINDHQQEKYFYEDELDDTSFEEEEEEEDDDDEDDEDDVDEVTFSYSDDYSLSSYSTHKHTILSKSPSIQSISSSSNYSSSINLNNIFTTTTTTTVSPSYINTTSQVMKSLPSTDSLTKLLQDSKPRTIPDQIDESIEFVSKNDTNSDNTKSVVFSNLTKSIKKNWRLLKNNPIFFLKESPRLTDDILPSENVKTSTIPDEPQELITFNKEETHHNNDLIKIPSSKSFKNRDHRINSTFLRLYAMDYNARAITKTLINQPLSNNTNDLNVFDDDDGIDQYINDNLIEFHQKYNLYRISNISRDKLWKSVILAPRLDNSPLNHINCDDYVYVGDEEITEEKDEEKSSESSEVDQRPVISRSYSLTRKQGNYLPWTTTSKTLNPVRSIKPAGILNNSCKLNHGLSPTSGFTKAQFTVKGWCNPRWIDTSNEIET